MHKPLTTLLALSALAFVGCSNAPLTPEGTGTGGPAALVCPAACPAATPAPMVGQDFVFDLVNLATSEITLRNVSGGELSLDGYQLWVGLEPEVLSSTTILADGESETIILTTPLSAFGELGLYIPATPADGADDPANVVAYVRWGLRDDRTGVPDMLGATATAAGVWTSAAAVELQPACNQNFVAVGDVSTGTGFTPCNP